MSHTNHETKRKRRIVPARYRADIKRKGADTMHIRKFASTVELLLGFADDWRSRGYLFDEKRCRETAGKLAVIAESYARGAT